MKQTPLPWTVDGTDLWHFGEGYNSPDDPHDYTAVGITNGLETSKVAHANLALIVRAVNCHEDLLDACKDSLHEFIRIQDLMGEADFDILGQTIAMLEEKIAKAEPQI